MFQITDEKTVRSVVRQNGIDRYFETPDIRFRLFHFHKGEYLASPDLRSEYIQFITKGEISIFHIGEDGTIYSLAHTNGIFLLGDMQFITPEEVPAFYAEARTEAETARLVSQTIGRSYTQQAVHKRRRSAALRLAALIGLPY